MPVMPRLSLQQKRMCLMWAIVLRWHVEGTTIYHLYIFVFFIFFFTPVPFNNDSYIIFSVVILRNDIFQTLWFEEFSGLTISGLRDTSLILIFIWHVITVPVGQLREEHFGGARRRQRVCVAWCFYQLSQVFTLTSVLSSKFFLTFLLPHLLSSTVYSRSQGLLSNFVFPVSPFKKRNGICDGCFFTHSLLP